MIDPPSGWMYGFPKELPEGLDKTDIREWLIKEGLPKELVKLGHCRTWFEERDD